MKPYFLRNKINIILIVIFSVGFLTPREKLENTYYIWNENLPFPSLENMDYPKNSTDVMVHRAGSDKYNFLHDAAIVGSRDPPDLVNSRQVGFNSGHEFEMFY